MICICGHDYQDHTVDGPCHFATEYVDSCNCSGFKKPEPEMPETEECSNVVDDQTCLERDIAEPCEFCIARRDKKLTLPEFIQKHGLGFSCHHVDTRPDGLMSEEPEARHFRCRISAPVNNSCPTCHQEGDSTGRCSNNQCINWGDKIWELRLGTFARPRSMGLYFTQGSAHTADPTLAEVLSCLASDAAGYENASSLRNNRDKLAQFCAWCAEYGYDTDSRQAEKIFRAIKRQAEQLKRTIGAAAYEELLWETEQE